MARSSSDPQAAMAEMLAQHGEQIGKLTADQQEVQRQFEQLRAIVDGLVQQDRRQQGYTPTPPPRWWQLEGADRDDAINTLHRERAGRSFPWRPAPSCRRSRLLTPRATPRGRRAQASAGGSATASTTPRPTLA